MGEKEGERKEEEKGREEDPTCQQVPANIGAAGNGHYLLHGLENPQIRGAQGLGLLIGLQILSVELLRLKR